MPLAFFATHYGSLTDDFSYHPNIRNMHMSTLVDDEKCEVQCSNAISGALPDPWRQLIFLYKLAEGVASGSFGTHVAKLAGVPDEVVKRATLISDDFAKQFKEKIEGKQKRSAASKLPLVAQADFEYLFGLATAKYSLPDDEKGRKHVLGRMKQVARKYIGLVI
jgi:DNA mismatch repair protein MSH6